MTLVVQSEVNRCTLSWPIYLSSAAAEVELLEPSQTQEHATRLSLGDAVQRGH